MGSVVDIAVHRPKMNVGLLDRFSCLKDLRKITCWNRCGFLFAILRIFGCTRLLSSESIWLGAIAWAQTGFMILVLTGVTLYRSIFLAPFQSITIGRVLNIFLFLQTLGALLSVVFSIWSDYGFAELLKSFRKIYIRCNISGRLKYSAIWFFVSAATISNANGISCAFATIEKRDLSKYLGIQANIGSSIGLGLYIIFVNLIGSMQIITSGVSALSIKDALMSYNKDTEGNLLGFVVLLRRREQGLTIQKMIKQHRNLFSLFLSFRILISSTLIITCTCSLKSMAAIDKRSIIDCLLCSHLIGQEVLVYLSMVLPLWGINYENDKTFSKILEADMNRCRAINLVSCLVIIFLAIFLYCYAFEAHTTWNDGLFSLRKLETSQSSEAFRSVFKQQSLRIVLNLQNFAG